MSRGQITITDEEVDALRKVLDHFWDDEFKDFEQAEKEGAEAGHIFNYLQTLEGLCLKAEQ